VGFRIRRTPVRRALWSPCAPSYFSSSDMACSSCMSVVLRGCAVSVLSLVAHAGVCLWSLKVKSVRSYIRKRRSGIPCSRPRCSSPPGPIGARIQPLPFAPPPHLPAARHLGLREALFYAERPWRCGLWSWVSSFVCPPSPPSRRPCPVARHPTPPACSHLLWSARPSLCRCTLCYIYMHCPAVMVS
jgi:hypothetical protein